MSFVSCYQVGIKIPANAFQIEDDRITYLEHHCRFWLSTPMDGQVLSDSFSQDAGGRRDVNLACKVPKVDHKYTVEEVGGDLGFKTSLAFSDGATTQDSTEYKELEEKLGRAQRAYNSKQSKNISARIKNRRRDPLHQESTKAVKNTTSCTEAK